MRGEATIKRRRWKRKRRSIRANPEELQALELEYREVKKELRKAIKQAKVESWKELIATIEKDPWGLPYKVVLRKLRSPTLGLTEQLEEDQVNIMLQSLFPRREMEEEELTSDLHDETESLEIERDKKVTSMEVSRVINRPGAGNPAPGLDGITTSIMKCIPNETYELAAKAFSACLMDCHFPVQWKRAALVLIPKTGCTAEGLPKCRPICLISEVGKIFERLIADRMKRWMADNPQHQLSENQFGFREGRSTCDALAAVKNRIVRERADGGVTVAVSLDIENAFNSIPWWRIMEAMDEKEFPLYLRRLIKNYLRSRWVEYPTGGGGRGTMTVEAGVPQGSVLGPLLWNVAFDVVVRDRVETGCGVFCYADDTLILASADTACKAVGRASLQTGLVLNRIRRMGLRVATQKTEVVMFDSVKSRKTQEMEITHVQVGDARIKIAKNMKYLGVVLDNRLTFKDHFQMIEKKAVNVSRALCRLMPNLRGPTEAKRKLYVETVKSVILYGAPIWSEELQRSRSSMRELDRVMRTLALRAISAYRTVSLDAALLLARIPPLYLLANERKRVYERIRDLTCNGDSEKRSESREAANNIRKEEALLLRRQWAVHLRRPGVAGKRTGDAVLPCMERWLGRCHGGMSFRLTQLLTGHGCFATYLHRIGKKENPLCDHCEAEMIDSVEHTLAVCEAWSAERDRLREAIGIELTMKAVVAAMSSTEEAWVAVETFAESVLTAKEVAEREKQAAEAARQSRLPDSDDSVG